MHHLYQRPIPLCNNAPTAAAYGTEPFNPTHAQNLEELVPIEVYNLKGENFYNSLEAQTAPYAPYLKGTLKHVWCRKTIAEKLQTINAKLADIGLELWLLDGYRSIECQRSLWQWITEEAAREKGLQDDELIAYCARYVSNPTDFSEIDATTWPTHSTGGAVDVTLRQKNGKKLDMGEAFDGMSESAHTDYLERLDAKGELSPAQQQALQNRRLLFWLLTEAGFANYPYEYWHFDYGTQMWRMNRRSWGLAENTPAWYGYTHTPKEEDA